MLWNSACSDNAFSERRLSERGAGEKMGGQGFAEKDSEWREVFRRAVLLHC